MLTQSERSERLMLGAVIAMREAWVHAGGCAGAALAKLGVMKAVASLARSGNPRLSGSFVALGFRGHLNAGERLRDKSNYRAANGRGSFRKLLLRFAVRHIQGF